MYFKFIIIYLLDLFINYYDDQFYLLKVKIHIIGGDIVNLSNLNSDPTQFGDLPAEHTVT